MEPAREPETAESSEGSQAGRRRGPGRNLPIAVGVGAGLGGLVLVSLFTVKEIFLVVMTVFLLVGLRELVVAFKSGHDINVPLVPVGVGGIAMVAFGYVHGPIGLAAAFGLTTLALLVWRMPAGESGYVRDTASSVLSLAYVWFMAGAVALMLAPDDGAQRIVIFIAVTVSSDIGGFFVGAFLGRHKMAPTISPKKTWEGTAGSLITCMLVAAWLVPWLLDGGKIWHGVLLGAAVMCSATLGDLIESMIKRDLGIKDLGSLLPEHGGVMDRVDSLLATAPVAWLLLELFVSPSG